ncbi:hypothetical protein R1flu_024653 [Riccia fluitans]|uniref:Gustatory receptor n=1 Tax=Riccia fluitans TaxID=41844 RepID=A0ABD1XYG7_9MARC
MIETPTATTPLLLPFSKNSRDVDYVNLRLKPSCNWDILDRVPSTREPPAPTLVRLQSVRKTFRTLQLDHSQSSWGFVSYLVGFFMLIVVPICKVLFVKSSSDDPRRQLVFQPVVIIIGVSRSLVSFVFLSHAIRKHGLRGVLFLDSVAAEVAQVRKDYDTVIELGSTMLVKLFVPAFILYLCQLLWLYSQVDLEPLPLALDNSIIDLIIIVICTALSWIFQTTTYLYACVLFWKVCKLQELKMRQYFQMLAQGLDAEYYVLEYDRIIRDLGHTSHRFRHFLAFTGVISVSGALIAMYEVVNSLYEKYELCLWGELVVLTVVNLTGAWLCLRSASKIAHLHRRIVKRASCIHAERTLGCHPVASPTLSTDLDGASESQDSKLKRIELYCQRQDSYARRAALVNFLSTSVAGISVYGFILDRFFVHTSVEGQVVSIRKQDYFVWNSIISVDDAGPLESVFIHQLIRLAMHYRVGEFEESLEEIRRLKVQAEGK